MLDKIPIKVSSDHRQPQTTHGKGGYNVTPKTGIDANGGFELHVTGRCAMHAAYKILIYNFSRFKRLRY